MEKNEFDRILVEKTEELNRVIDKYLPREEGPQRIVAEAMNYSVRAGGKRLRPMLMQEAFLLCGGKQEDRLFLEPFLAAVEMIHTYSLVHDDLPAMDNDEYRRGRKTAWAVYGEAVGILAGDGLLNYAFETAMSVFDCCGCTGKPITSLYSSREYLNRAARALSVLANKAGIRGMIGGQTADVELTGKEVSPEKLDFIYRLKTGALLEVSMMIGAILGGADREQVKAVEKIASCVGTAFQIQDDILDVVGDARVIGKPVLSDEKNEKTTYVTLYGMEAARKAVMELSKEAEEILESLPGDHEFLSCLIDILITRVK